MGILVGGDALAATTHMSILVEARKAGVPVKVIHGPSIFSAIAETGLHLYKFGRAVTIPYAQEGYEPTGFYDDIRKNLSLGLHTLILLDVKPPRYMTVLEGLETLLKIEKSKGSGVLTERKVVAACQLGGSGAIRYATPKQLMQDKSLEATPAVIIIPGELHFSEKEYLESL